jgi:hypothetical protein
MYLRKITLTAAAVAAFTPVLSQASPERAALTSCSRAFAANLASPGAAAPAFKVVLRGAADVGSVSQFFAREYTFYLRANDQKTGLPLARATCSTDASGTVVAFSQVAADAAYPSLASLD